MKSFAVVSVVVALAAVACGRILPAPVGCGFTGGDASLTRPAIGVLPVGPVEEELTFLPVNPGFGAGEVEVVHPVGNKLPSIVKPVVNTPGFGAGEVEIVHPVGNKLPSIVKPVVITPGFGSGDVELIRPGFTGGDASISRPVVSILPVGPIEEELTFLPVNPGFGAGEVEVVQPVGNKLPSIVKPVVISPEVPELEIVLPGFTGGDASVTRPELGIQPIVIPSNKLPVVEQHNADHYIIF